MDGGYNMSISFVNFSKLIPSKAKRDLLFFRGRKVNFLNHESNFSFTK